MVFDHYQLDASIAQSLLGGMISFVAYYTRATSKVNVAISEGNSLFRVGYGVSNEVANVKLYQA